MLKRASIKSGTKITFVLPDSGAGPVSVVGDFNEWTPGAHTLVSRADGTRTVSAVLPTGRVTAFRYLATGGCWFDDETADHHDGVNGYIHT